LVWFCRSRSPRQTPPRRSSYHPADVAEKLKNQELVWGEPTVADAIGRVRKHGLHSLNFLLIFLGDVRVQVMGPGVEIGEGDNRTDRRHYVTLRILHQADHKLQKRIDARLVTRYVVF